MSVLCELPSLSRRGVLLTGGTLFAWAFVPRFARAAGTADPRLIVIILRGALDGLSAVAPVGDPAYAGLHGQIALSLDGDHAAIPLDGFFALHPAMPVFARLYKDNQAAVVHATATGYRERSHFDGQDVLESGYPGPGAVRSGWLNRAFGALPKGDRVALAGGLAVGPSTPLIMRGPAPVLGWAPQIMPAASDDLASRVMDLYAQRDPILKVVLAKGLETEKIAAREGMSGEGARPRGGMDSAAGMRLAAEGAVKLIAADDGPRVAALAFEAALLPGIVLGVAAVAAPKYVPKLGAALNPLFRSAVRGTYKISQKTKEMLAEAHEQVNDIVAEVNAEGDIAKPVSKPVTAG